MRNIPMGGKFLFLLGLVALFVTGVTGSVGWEMVSIDQSYNYLIDGEVAATTSLARANRSIQLARASIGDLLMARTDAAKSGALCGLSGARGAFIGFIDAAILQTELDATVANFKSEGVGFHAELSRLGA